jgi:hypothetical protein
VPKSSTKELKHPRPSTKAKGGAHKRRLHFHYASRDVGGVHIYKHQVFSSPDACGVNPKIKNKI